MAGEGDVKLLGAAVSPFAVLARAEGRELRVRPRGHGQQERPPPEVQPGAQEGARAHPRRQARLRVASHRRVRGRGLGHRRPLHPPDRPLPARRCPFLGRLRRRSTAGANLAAACFLQLFPAYFGIERAATEAERAEKVKETVAVISQLEAALSNGKPFFAGDSVGYLDIVVGCHLFWLEAFSRMFGVALVDASKTPLFAAWAERFGEDEVASKGVVPGADKVVEYFKKKHQAR